MGRGTALTEEDKQKIAALSSVGASSRAIAGAAGRSKSVVQNCLKSPAQYGIKKSLERERKMTPVMRCLTRAAVDGATSSNGLRQSLNLLVSSSTVRRALNDCGKFKYKKKKYAPLLTAEQKNPANFMGPQVCNVLCH